MFKCLKFRRSKVVLSSLMGLSLCSLISCAPLDGLDADGSEANNAAKKSQQMPEVEITNGHFNLACGSSTANLEYRITTPKNRSGNLFAMLLNGSPGTQYFSDSMKEAKERIKNSGNALPLSFDSIPDVAEGLAIGLLNQGYKIIEVRYEPNPVTWIKPNSMGGTSSQTMSGFYSVCLRAGLDQVEIHNADLYDRLIENLQYDPRNPEHRLIGFGGSLGAIQVQSMAFRSGKKFEKVGITGVLMGNVQKGCQLSHVPLYNGWRWSDFMDFANAITVSGDGCRGTDAAERDVSGNEYTHHYNFSNARYRTRWDLGIFEGNRQHSIRIDPANPLSYIFHSHGNNEQANYISQQRNTARNTLARSYQAQPEATTLRLYNDCGHESILCSKVNAITSGNLGANTALEDILEYFDPKRRGLDLGYPRAPHE